MNDAQQTETRRFAETAASLLKEYSSKLEPIQTHMRRLRDKVEKASFGSPEFHVVQQEYLALQQSFHTLRVSLRTLAQRVSQFLEHGDVDDVWRLELEVRLHELEGKLHQTEMIVDVGLPAHASA